MLGSGIGAGDLRSRLLHVDLHAELHHIENSRPAHSAPHFARPARFSFIWRRPSPKNLKSSCSRHKPPKPPGGRRTVFWCGRRDLNSRTIDWMVSRVVGLEAHWTPPCYVLDQARLRPHEPPASTSGFIYLMILNQDALEQTLPNKGLDATRKPRHVSVVVTSSREPKGALSVRASWNLPSRPYRTRNRCSRLASSRHHYFRGSPHPRIRIWSDGRSCHPSARQDLRSAHKPGDNARPHNRWKNNSGNVCPVHFIPSSRRTTGGVHGETDFQPIRVPSRPRHYETG